MKRYFGPWGPWSCVRIPRVCQRVLNKKKDSLDDPQCALGILRYRIWPSKWCFFCVTKSPPVQFSSVKEFNAQRRKKLAKILGTFLPYEFRTHAALPITLPGLGVRKCRDQYKTSCVDFVLFKNRVSKITDENSKKLQNFSASHFQYSTSLPSKLFANTIQIAPENKKFLSLSVWHAGAWLSAPIPAQFPSARFVKQEFLTSMLITALRVVVEETQLVDMTGFEIK